VIYQQPVHALRETFGFRKAYAEGANAHAETAWSRRRPGSG
jgi:hypothetical protein